MARRRSPGLTKRGRIWWTHKTVYGVKLRESTGTEDLAEAERYLAFRVEQIRRQTVYGERPGVTFRQAAEKYLREACPTKSLTRAAYAIDHMMPHIGDVDVTLIHEGSLNGWRDERAKAGSAAGTLNRELATLTRILTLCARVWRHDNGRPYIDTAPLLRLSDGPKRPPTVLPWDAQPELLAALPSRQAEMALFAVNTGLRQGELCALRWDWLVPVPELETEVFILPAEITKNGQSRVVVVNSVAMSVLKAQPRTAKHVFVNRFGRRYRTLYGPSWKAARERIGLPTLRVHDLRHTFGHRLRAAGVGLEDRADLLGHYAGRMTTHYSAPELGRLLEAAERIVTSRPTTLLSAVRNGRTMPAQPQAM